MLTEDVSVNLDLYYAWSRVSSPSDIGYPHQDPVRRLRGSGVGAEGLSDEEAQELDRALCMLRKEDPAGYLLVELVHKKGRTFRQLEAHGRGNRRRLARQLSAAHAFISGVICCQA